MATQTRPFFKTGAALATAAAIVVASPAIAPNLTPSPNALSAAQVELTTFADLLSITPSDWNNYFYIGWGGAIGPINVDPQTIEADYWLPQCDYDCLVPGVSGLAYLGLDALINGNGNGIADAPNWGTSGVNYFFEGGLSTGVQYILQKPFATGAPLENEQIFNAIKLAFQIGSGNLWITAYVNALSAIAVLAEPIPVIGEYLYRGIGSYIGPAFVNIDTLYDYSAYAGLPGVARYIKGVILTGGNPNPYPTVAPEPSASVSAKSVAALSSPVAPATSASPDTSSDTPEAEVAAPKPGETPSGDSTPAAGDSSESTSTEAASDTKPADTTPAVDSPSSAVADSTADATPAATKPADAPAKASKRPARKAAERAAKKIASAISGAAKAASASVSGS